MMKLRTQLPNSICPLVDMSRCLLRHKTLIGSRSVCIARRLLYQWYRHTIKRKADVPDVEFIYHSSDSVSIYSVKYTADIHRSHGANMCLWPVCQIFMAGPRRHGAHKVPNTWSTVHNVCMNISHTNTARNKYDGVRSTFRSEFRTWPLAPECIAAHCDKSPIEHAVFS